MSREANRECREAVVSYREANRRRHVVDVRSPEASALSQEEAGGSRGDGGEWRGTDGGCGRGTVRSDEAPLRRGKKRDL